MDAKKKRERSLFRDLLIVICLCIPFVIVALLKAVISLVRKVSAYLQSEWERFNDLYFGDRCDNEQQTDPALIAHIKGEGPVPGEQCPQTTAGNAESHHFKQTTQQTNKAVYNRQGQNNTSASKQQKVGLIKIRSPSPPVEEQTLKNANVRRSENVASTRPVLSDQRTVASEHYNVSSRKDTCASNEVKRKPKFYLHVLRAVIVLVNALLLVPRKVCTYFQRVLEDFSDIHGDDSGADLPYTEPAFIAYLKGEEGAPFINNPHIKFSKSGSANLENVSVDSEIAKGESQSQGQNEKATKGVRFVRLVKGLCYCIRGVIWDLNSRFRHLTFRPRVNAEINGTISQDISRYYNVGKEQNEDKATNFDRSHQAEKLHENAATHSGSVSSSPARVVSSEQGRLFNMFNCFGVSRTARNDRNLHTSPNTAMDTGPKLFTSSLQQAGARTKQWNASPAVGKRAEVQIKVSKKGNANSPAATRARKDTREEKKPKKETVPPFVISSAHVDVSAPTPRRTGVYTGPKLFSVPEYWNTPQTIHKPEEKPENVTAGINSSAHVDISSPTSSNTVVYNGPKLFSVPESWYTPPTVSKLLEKDVKLSSEGKAHREVMSATPFDSKTNSAAKTQECKEKAEHKVKERVTPDVISPTNLDTPAPTTPAEEKAKRRSMPSLIQTACKYLIGCVTTQVQEEKAPIVAHSSQIWPADVCSDSQVLESENIKMSSTKEQIDVDPTVSRGKRAKNEEDNDKESWHAQAYIDRTENSPPECRNAKRKAERSRGPSSKSASSRTVSRRQRHRVNEQKQETVTSVLSEPMEVGESPPETPFTGPPEPMETGGEQYAVVFPCGELGGTNQSPVNKSFVEEEEPMEIECDESEPMEIDPEPSEAMETNQGTFLDEFSFAWENIMQTFFNQPDEEMMEIDPCSVPATPCTAQVEEILESMQEPAVMPIYMPFGPFNSFQWPLITSMKTSETTFAVPQKATVESNQELADACKPVQTASGYVSNVDRSLAFTEEVPKDTITAVRTPDAEQTVIEPVIKLVMASPLTDRVTSPPLVETETPPSGKPSTTIYSEPLQSLEDKINNELADKQSMIEPMIKPDMEPLLIERVTSPPLEKTDTQPSSKPSAAIYSEHLQRMEEKLNNETDTASIEQQNLVAVETEEEIPETQLTMEQLQLMPELGYFPDGLDSDSDEEDSDEEYELDFGTIDQFLELDAEPEHVDLINQLLTKRELASELE